MSVEMRQQTNLVNPRGWRRASLSALTVALCCLCSFMGCDDDAGGGISNDRVADLNIVPDPIVFNAGAVGSEQVRVATLQNNNEGVLRITEITLSNELSALEFELTVDGSPVQSLLPLEIEGYTDRQLTITYRPQNIGVDSGHIIFRSNDRDGREYQLPILSSDGGAELVFPNQTTFTVTPCESSKLQTVSFVNLGTAQVQLSDVRFTPDSSPAFEIQAERIILSDGAVINEGQPGSREIAQGATFEVDVLFTRRGAADAESATLELVYVDAEEETPVYRALLVGAELVPAVEVVPQRVDFGPYDLNVESEIQQIQLINLGATPLNIESISLAINDPAINDQFTLHDVDAPRELGTEASTSFGVSYRPVMSGAHRTSVSVSFGECEGQVSIPLSGRLREPCLQIAPSEVNLGVIAQGQQSAPTTLELLNCGDVDVEVSSVGVEGSSDFMWSWLTPNISLPFTLTPRMTTQLQVSYTNTNLAEGSPDTGTLFVQNDTPETPRLEVPLRVGGGGVPTCDLRVVPERMNFGLVSRGRSVTRELKVLNVGTGACEIRGQEITPLIEIPIPGFDTVKFTLTRPVQGTEVLAGQFLPFEVTYTPDVFNSDIAIYKLSYFDPFTQSPLEATAELSGVAGESNIEVIPGRLDFGQVTAGTCASREERVTVYNTGLVDLCITDIVFEGEGCGEFFVVDRPVADADGCIVVTRNRPADVTLVYEPGALGPDECNLVFISDAADTPELSVPLLGEGVSSGRTVDEFVQTSGQTVDVLFVIDNSGSMGEEQDNLEDNFARFINGAQQFNNDYQIGVVTTDMEDDGDSGRLQGGQGRILRRGPNIEADFGRVVSVGTGGSGTERGLEAARSALSDPLAFDTGVSCQSDSACVAPDTCVEGVCGGYNRGFIREQAALEVIFVSDEDDFSDASLNFYVDFLKNIKGFRNEALFHASAIVGAENGRASSCDGPGGEASAGSRYVEVANRTNGRVFSICSADFGGPLQEIGNRAFGLPIQFFLSRPADQSTLEVAVDGRDRPSGWSYDSPSNSVVFEEASVPQPGDTVRVEYEAQCFPRRNN